MVHQFLIVYQCPECLVKQSEGLLELLLDTLVTHPENRRPAIAVLPMPPWKSNLLPRVCASFYRINYYLEAAVSRVLDHVLLGMDEPDMQSQPVGLRSVENRGNEQCTDCLERMPNIQLSLLQHVEVCSLSGHRFRIVERPSWAATVSCKDLKCWKLITPKQK